MTELEAIGLHRMQSQLGRTRHVVVERHEELAARMQSQIDAQRVTIDTLRAEFEGRSDRSRNMNARQVEQTMTAEEALAYWQRNYIDQNVNFGDASIDNDVRALEALVSEVQRLRDAAPAAMPGYHVWTTREPDGTWIAECQNLKTGKRDVAYGRELTSERLALQHLAAAMTSHEPPPAYGVCPECRQPPGYHKMDCTRRAK